jgi:hypothetical protein
MGEHVLPAWLLRDRYPVSDGPYFSTVNGEEVLNRDGAPRSNENIARWLVPACEVCNAELERRFEQPAIDVIRRMHDDPWGAVLTPDEVAAVGLWFVKTWSLIRHPGTVTSEPAYAGIVKPWRPPLDDASWMVTGAPPPAGLSFWLSRVTTTELPIERIHLPQLSDGSRTVQFDACLFSIDDFRGDLVYHPGWPVAFPEVDMSVVQLWPSVGKPLNLSALGDRSFDVHYVEEGPSIRFLPGHWCDVLPPLSPGIQQFQLAPGVQMVSF